MKKVLRKLLVCILIAIIVINFISVVNGSNVYAADEWSPGATLLNICTGLIGLLLYPVTLLPTAIFIGLSDIVGAIAKLSIGDIASYGGIAVDWVILTPFHILFNKIPLVDINFFNLTGVSGTILSFRQAVAGWYYTMRLIAMMVLAVILIYIGIRMAISTIASEKAMYKKMLVDWATSLALLFLLHYIILFVFACNEALVNAMAKIGEATNSVDSMMTAIQLLCFHYDIVIRITAIVIYGMLIFQTLSFLISYIKRMFTVGFLIIISPLITITYSIDKIGDGKAQALNNWLKEFVYNILIQPFQCILYLVFAELTYDLMTKQTFNFFTTTNVGTAIFAILSLQFIKEGEKIVKKIFGFDKASSLTDMAAGAAMTYAAISKGKDAAKKAGGSVSKLKNTIGTSKAMQSLKSGMNKSTNKAVQAMKGAGNGVRKFTDSVASRFVSEDKMKAKKEKKERKREEKEEKFEKSVQALAQQKWNEQGHTGEPSQKFIDAIRTQEKENKQKKKISGRVGNAYKSFKQSPVGETISGMGQYFKDNKKAIVGAGLGMFTAGAGMAAGDFGDISKAVAGYGLGSGFMAGYYQNSAKELKKQSEALAQMDANLSGDTNIQNIFANAQVEGENDIGKEIKEALKQLQNALKGMDNKNQVIGAFNQQALDKNQAGSITRDSIAQMLEDNGFEGDTSAAVDSFAKYGHLLAMKGLHSNIESASAMGIDRDSLAGIIGDRQAVGGTTVQETTTVTETEEETITETQYRDMPVEELAQHILGTISTSSGYTNVQGLDETNRKIDELNKLINSLQSSNEQRQTEITQAISQNNANIKSYDDLISGLNSQLSTLQTKKTEFQA